VLFAWPSLERRITRDHRRHDLLDRPLRTAIGAAFLSWVVIVFAVGSTDQIFYRLHIPYPAQIHFWRIGVWVLPILVFFITASACRGLQRGDRHPLRTWEGSLVRRRPDGALEVLADDGEEAPAGPSEPPVGTAPGQPPK
jgi:ubiquinol-cytochrome c reductase cytochrome b subunit